MAKNTNHTQTTPVTVTPTPIPNTDSLAIVEGDTDTGLAIAGMDQAFEVLDTAERVSSPYAQFAHPKSPSWDTVLKHYPDAEEGDVMLVTPKHVINLDPFKFVLLQGSQWFYEEDAQYKPVRTFKEKGENRKEMFDILGVAVDVPGLRCHPFRMTFKTTKAPAIRDYLRELELARDNPEKWIERSDQHRAASKIKDPRFQMYASLALTSKTAASTGRPFKLAKARMHAMTSAIYSSLQEFFADPVNRAILAECSEHYDIRLREMQGKLVK